MRLDPMTAGLTEPRPDREQSIQTRVLHDGRKSKSPRIDQEHRRDAGRHLRHWWQASKAAHGVVPVDGEYGTCEEKEYELDRIYDPLYPKCAIASLAATATVREQPMATTHRTRCAIQNITGKMSE